MQNFSASRVHFVFSICWIVRNLSPNYKAFRFGHGKVKVTRTKTTEISTTDSFCLHYTLSEHIVSLQSIDTFRQDLVVMVCILLETVDSVVDLGATFNPKLPFVNHINKMTALWICVDIIRIWKSGEFTSKCVKFMRHSKNLPKCHIPICQFLNYTCWSKSKWFHNSRSLPTGHSYKFTAYTYYLYWYLSLHAWCNK